MELIESKLWNILKLAHKGELNPVAMEYLKSGLGGFFAKYVYDKDLSHKQFLKWLESDVEYKRVDILNLLDNLSKIYYFHRDFDSAIDLRELKLKEIEDDEKGEKIPLEYYSLANWLFENGDYKEALKSIESGIGSIDTQNLTKVSLKLLIESMIMKEQLRMLLSYDIKIIASELEKISGLLVETSKHLSKQDADELLVMVQSLIVSNSVDREDYTNAITVGKKAFDAIESKNLDLKLMLKYYLYEKLSYAYLFEKEYENAIGICKRALGLKQKLSSIPLYSTLIILVESYVALKEYDEALRYAHEANSYVNNSVDKLEYIYEMLAKLYEAKGDEKSSYEYQEKLKHLEEGIKQIV